LLFPDIDIDIHMDMDILRTVEVDKQGFRTGARGMDHAAYQAKVKGMTVAELRWTVKDCKEALAANPSTPKAGYYQDEINYCCQELSSRK
jgi:hypothetical protein